MSFRIWVVTGVLYLAYIFLEAKDKYTARFSAYQATCRNVDLAAISGYVFLRYTFSFFLSLVGGKYTDLFSASSELLEVS